MTRKELIEQIKIKKSMLCVGLDPKPEKVPAKYAQEEDPTLSFLIDVVDQTAEYSVAYKPNLAFFEADGVQGLARFAKLVDHINANHPNHLLIADAKRGDIGSTASMYAKTFFETFSCDAVTLSPYMGIDTLKPFSGFEGKWMVVLGLTSNPGAEDIELAELASGKKVYQHTMSKAAAQFDSQELMFVVGATRPEILARIREEFPDYFFLVPGVGAQGGTVEEVCEAACTGEGGLLINASRSILFPSNEAALPHAEAAKELQKKMEVYISSSSSAS